jgi:hypothetical protein
VQSIVGPAVVVAVDGTMLSVQLADADRQTPSIVNALVAAGARILEVRPEMPALEDVYLHLMENSLKPQASSLPQA